MHKGLSWEEASKLQQKFGKNKLREKKQWSAISLFVSQFQSPLLWVLMVASLVPLYTREYVEVVLILSVVILNVIMGFFQEYSAKKTLVALTKILEAKAIVVRGGLRQEINAEDLVVGDLVVLGAGDRVPADGKLIEGEALLVNEAILTGEEQAVTKREFFMGTTVAAGIAVMQVTKIGAMTEIGKIGVSLTEIKEEKTPLQAKLERFARDLVLIIIAVCFILFLTGKIVYGRDTILMLKMAVILSVAAIPEGLPIAVTVVMAVGMGKILKKKGLVKKLLSIETLGSTSVICTDKTGTLTAGKMQVKAHVFFDREQALRAYVLTNNERTPLELALWHFAREKNVERHKLQSAAPRIYDEPFTSANKYSLSINEVDDVLQAFMLGAPDVILNFCRISQEEKREIMKRVFEWGEKGLKVLGSAYKNTGDLKEKREFVWSGMVGISDPVRPEVKHSIEKAIAAGVNVKIVTGDFRATAEKIAHLVGIKIHEGELIEGKDLGEMKEDELIQAVSRGKIFARVTPAQKLKIVEVLQKMGEAVAMTGDGVNDALALKKADIGIVMGEGAEVAKQAGDLILLDGNFKTIVAAIEEGRVVFSNIKKVVAYTLSNSFVEIVLISAAMMLGMPAPLTVAQILWLHLICDGPPDLMLAFEPKEAGIMNEKPKDMMREAVLGRQTKFIIGSVSLSVGLLTLLIFNWFNRAGDLILARTVVFTTLAVVDLVYIFSFKNLRVSVFQMHGFFNNPYLFAGVIYGLVLTFAAVYVPFFNRLVGTVPLPLPYWGIIIGVSFVATFLIEMSKRRRG